MPLHQRPRPYHLGTFFVNRRPPWVPTLVVGVVFVFALLFVTVPNWDEFSRNFSQFPALWQINSNRREIVFLVIRVCSPLLLAGIAAACCWLWYTVKEYRQPVPPPSSRSQEDSVTAPAQPQRDKRAPTLPITPIPPVLPDVAAPVGKGSQQATGHEEEQAVLVERTVGEPFDEQNRGESGVSGSAPADNESGAPAGRHPVYVIINVLQALTIQLQVPGGKRYAVPLNLNAKEVQLIAYLAYLRGQTISLDKLREHIFGHGKADEDATPKKLQDALDTAKKEIRRQIRQVIEQVNKEAGSEVIPPDLDIFTIRNKRYSLSEVCSVSDLSIVEKEHRIIQQAFDDGLLIDSIPDAVYEACNRLRGAYKGGDFLSDLIQESPEDVGPWVRKPFTLYKDYFLQAVLYVAEYELRAAQQLTDERWASDEAAEEGRQRQRSHYSRAAQLYRTYALRGCDSRADLKVTFGVAGKTHGERVDMSERALRRCITLYGILGNTHLVNQVYTTYYRQMKMISSKVWEPSQDTRQDLEGALAQTNAYRFSMVMPPLPSSMDTADRSAVGQRRNQQDN
jgi:hypothetical protein